MRVLNASARPLLAAALLATVALTCARQQLPEATGNTWHIVTRAQAIPKNPDLCEDTWVAERPPHGRWDRIGLHRVAPCTGANATNPAAVLYLPGTHMNGELAVFDEAFELRLYLARRGVPVWSLDYRTHFVPPTTEDLEFMRQWTGEMFLEDTAAALAFVHRAGTADVLIAGFSRGASFAYALAEMTGQEDVAGGIAGLVILDGVAPGTLRSNRAKPVAIDIGGRRLSYPRRQALLARVIANPEAASTDPEFQTAGRRLAQILYTSAMFGGRGGLSDSLHGRADIQNIARLLISYDRYWPGAATPERNAAPQAVAPFPIFAVASTNIGEKFTEAVLASARRVGGPKTTTIVVPGSGHLDVLVGTDAREQVFEPLFRWVQRTFHPSLREP